MSRVFSSFLGKMTFVVCLTLGSVWGQVLPAELIVIAHPSVPVQNLNEEFLQKIFMGKIRRWSDGNLVEPATLREGRTHSSFVNDVLESSPNQFAAYWRRIIFTGKGRPPKTFYSESDLVDYVRRTPGAIGYIDSETPHDNVQVFEVY